LAERLQSVVVDKDERGMERASDHVPVVVEVG
jgi:exonuclease III